MAMMIPYSRLLLLIPCLGSIAFQAQAFVSSRSILVNGIAHSQEIIGLANNNRHDDGITALFSTPTGNRPPPRRTLKKRKNKRRQRMDQLSQNTREMNNNSHGSNSQQTLLLGEEDDVEVRPVRRRDAIEAGLDYWMEDGDLERERQRRIAEKNRKLQNKSMEGAISKEKLRAEVVAPYKQNWIGMISVFIATLSFIATKFPELLQIPVIPIPDL
eukprot:CAMPEP_0172316200 /NCGR_PEP_ID=MMETSP1058-20130122/27508_1 /TAXON_ID=83371 /ORGANISM="Detonula confervacea, Strain CCMP 353" /LENGTH=214 /DNA_ID=CAMNT_0013030457 /DNA_START=10 /DNA_END=654 /DNA_ORIENTATION=+